MRIRSLHLAVSSTLVFSSFCGVSDASADSYAPWLTQIGINSTVMSAANWGKGVLIGTVDTGIQASNPVFAAGQVSAASSSCAAVSFRCSNGYADDNGHGTAVAEIAAGNKTFNLGNSNYGGYLVTAGSYVSVAPNANIVAEKVLNAAGSGYSTDVANGIIKAANAGASIINVSITYGNSSDLVSAINYAASKGAIIVWAGGNSSQALLSNANTTGLTQQAINQLIFAGSVNAKNVLSSFSNTPGAGSLVNTAGAKTAYDARWIMAPGENILAPGIQYGSGAWAYWSGTSMSTPIISGSLAVLEAAWPILKTNATAGNLLLATATDLGAKGVDATYGNGIANLTTAFNPYGALSVTEASGKTVAVTSVTGSLLTSGAFGSLSAIQSKLANYTAFDTYSRNYTVNLSGLIKTPTVAATVNPLPVNTKTAPLSVKLADGSFMTYWDDAPSTAQMELGFHDAGTDRSSIPTGSMLMGFADGSSLALGFASNPSYMQAAMLYGDQAIAGLAAQTDSASLASLSSGGYVAGYSFKPSAGWRVSAMMSETQSLGANQDTFARNSSNFSVSVAHDLSDRLVGSVTLGLLSESNGMLGSTYVQGGMLGFGGSNNSNSIGFSLGADLGGNARLLLDAGFASTAGGQGSGLVSGTSGVVSRSLGVAFSNQDVMTKGDRFTVSAKQPLRVVSGYANLVMPAVDPVTGVATYSNERVSLVPNGRETDFSVSYSAPVARTQTVTLQAGLRNDLQNIAGESDRSVGVSWINRF